MSPWCTMSAGRGQWRLNVLARAYRDKVQRLSVFELFSLRLCNEGPQELTLKTTAASGSKLVSSITITHIYCCCSSRGGGDGRLFLVGKGLVSGARLHFRISSDAYLQLRLSFPVARYGYIIVWHRGHGVSQALDRVTQREVFKSLPKPLRTIHLMITRLHIPQTPLLNL